MANILCSSRFLCREIVILLYQNLKFRFIIDNGHDPHKIWIRFQATSKKLHVNRSFSSATDIEEFLNRFPFSKVLRPHFEIEIHGAEYPPLNSFLTQWMKVNSVVDFLKKLPTSSYVHVNSVKYWIESGSARRNNRLFTWSAKESYPWTDHDVHILPFTCLANWHYTLPANLRAAILKDPEALKQAQLHLFKSETPTGADRFNEVYTTFDISGMGQTYYIYEPCETSRIEESVRKVNAIFWEIMRSFLYMYIDVGIGDESQDRQLLVTYDRI